MLAGNVPGVSMAQWLAMTAAQQIPYIFAWWKKEIGAQPFPSTGGTLLALNFLPGQFQAVGADTNPSAILAGKSGPYATYYAQNASLDPNKTGRHHSGHVRTAAGQRGGRVGEVAWVPGADPKLPGGRGSRRGDGGVVVGLGDPGGAGRRRGGVPRE